MNISYTEHAQPDYLELQSEKKEYLGRVSMTNNNVLKSKAVR